LTAPFIVAPILKASASVSSTLPLPAKTETHTIPTHNSELDAWYANLPKGDKDDFEKAPRLFTPQKMGAQGQYHGNMLLIGRHKDDVINLGKTPEFQFVAAQPFAFIAHPKYERIFLDMEKVLYAKVGEGIAHKHGIMDSGITAGFRCILYHREYEQIRFNCVSRSTITKNLDAYAHEAGTKVSVACVEMSSGRFQWTYPQMRKIK
jgi:hypothetical protein